MYFQPSLSVKALFLFFAVFAVSCSDSEKEAGPGKAIISAQITNLPEEQKMVYLTKIGNKGPIRLDSAGFETGGKFKMVLPADSERLYLLELGTQRLPVFLESGLHELKADFKDVYGSAVYTNSPLTELLRKVESIRVSFEKRAQSLESGYNNAMMQKDIVAADSAIRKFYVLQKETKRFMKHLIDSIGPNPVSHLATSMLSVEDDFGYLDTLAMRFEKEKPGTAYTEKIVSYLKIPRILGIGKMAPDVSQPDPNGKPVTLSQFRGKWVLLDFWASWCKPCRAESPNLVAAHRKYKGKGFQILSISLDTDRDAWMKAIVADRLFWAHGSDLTPDNQAAIPYFVQTIPSSFLIDPEGKIAAKNLRGPALDKKLSEVFE